MVRPCPPRGDEPDDLTPLIDEGGVNDGDSETCKAGQGSSGSACHACAVVTGENHENQPKLPGLSRLIAMR